MHRSCCVFSSERLVGAAPFPPGTEPATTVPYDFHGKLALRDVQELVIRNGLNLAASKLQREVMLRHLVTVADESIKGLKSKEGKF